MVAEQLLPLASPLAVFFSLPVCFVPPPGRWGPISTSAWPESSDRRDVGESCVVAAHLLVLPSKQGRGTRGARWLCPHSQEGRRVLWRNGGVLCSEPNASRNRPSRLVAPQKRGF